jgi:hypothetical protein
MRIFLFLILFDMVFHSLAVLSPYTQWCGELGVRRLPYRLPTAAEVAELTKKGGPANPDPVADRVYASLHSVWSFFKPWPDQATRRKLTNWPDHGAYLLCWVASRLDFCEHVLGIRQDWSMFSPTVVLDQARSRARLVFADGSTEELRLPVSDTEDPSHYSRWFADRVNNYEVEVGPRDKEACLGFCNRVAYLHRANAKGNPLVRIELFQVTYRLPSPDEPDPAGFLRRQKGPPANQRSKAFFAADVKARPDGSMSVRQGKL